MCGNAQYVAKKKGHPEHDFCRDCNQAYSEAKDVFPSRLEWKRYVLENPMIRALIVHRHLERAQRKCHFLAEKASNIIEAIHAGAEAST